MGQNTTVLGIIGVVVILVVFLSPTLIAGLQNFVDNAFEGWSNFWSNLSGSGGIGNMGIGAVIHYEDGTNDTLDWTKKEPLISLSVSFEGKPFIFIEFVVYGSFGYTGEIIAFSTNYVELTYDFESDGTSELTSTNTIREDIPESGHAFRIGYLDVYAYQMEDFAETSGSYTSTVEASVSLEATFSSGETFVLEPQKPAKTELTVEVTKQGPTTPLYIFIQTQTLEEIPLV